MNKSKFVVADTNIWLLNPNWYECYKDCLIVVPQIVIEELDGKKNSPGVLGLNARRSCKTIGNVAVKYESDTVDHTGIVEYDDYSFLIIGCPKEKTYDLDLNINDNKIICTAFALKDTNPNVDVVLLSNDCNVRTKVSVQFKTRHVSADSYTEGQVNTAEYYNVERIRVTDDELIAKLYRSELRADDLPGLKCNAIHTPLYLEYNGKVILATIEKDGVIDFHVGSGKNVKGLYDLVGDIKPMNDGQKQFINMMKNENIKVMACIGKSGSGKSLLSLACALTLFEDGEFSHIKLIKPYVSLGNTVGYLKGTLEEKIDPIKQSFVTVLETLGYNLDELEHQGTIDFSVPEFERGQTYHNTIVIIDECQNLTNVEIKSLITRCSESSKVVLLGDTKQVDSLYLSESYNGLAHVMDKLMGQRFFGGMYLWKSERADFIDVVDELL